MTHHPHHDPLHDPLHCILPPHMLEHIARTGDATQRERALDALATDTTLRSRRIIRSFTTMAPAMPVTTPNKQRRVHDANHGTGLPGTLVRSEGQGPTGDVEVNEAYDGAGATFDMFWSAYSRNSIDNAGMPLVSTAHYSTGYNNAFWNGAQMTYGDGDGVYFNRFTAAIDVIGHEMTHGVTSYQANLEYHDQPGALNESISDVFGSLVKQFSHSPQQTAAGADWLIGQGLFTAKVNGVALRSMKAPGTAYDDPHLGKDPQPAHMSAFVHTTADNGGVHINSGIPNRAFYLLATALGGFAWERAGKIWYVTLCDPRLSSTAQFQDFANLTVANAATLFGAGAQQATIEAWAAVGISSSPKPLKISGQWVLHFDWGVTGRFSQVPLTFNADGTFTGGGNGLWQQKDGTLMLHWNTGPAIYSGSLDGDIGSGAMTTFAGSDGSWYLYRQGNVGLVPPTLEEEAPQHLDATGNPVPVGAGAAG